MNETQPPPPPVAGTYTCTLGPGYEPNFHAVVTIEAKSRDRRFFLVRLQAVDDPAFGVQCGKVFTVHQSKLTPAVDWETWKPAEPEAPTNAS